MSEKQPRLSQRTFAVSVRHLLYCIAFKLLGLVPRNSAGALYCFCPENPSHASGRQSSAHLQFRSAAAATAANNSPSSPSTNVVVAKTSHRAAELAVDERAALPPAKSDEYCIRDACRQQ